MADTIETAYKKRLPLLDDLARKLQKRTEDELSGLEHIDRIVFRPKAIESFVKKVSDRRHGYRHPLEQVEDQVAGRIIVFFRSDIPLVRDCLLKSYTRVESVSKKPATDAEFGYESEHLVCVLPHEMRPPGWEDQEDMPNTFELQIRTIFMHAWAEPYHNIGYKGGEAHTGNLKRELSWIAASAWGADHAFDRVLRIIREN